MVRLIADGGAIFRKKPRGLGLSRRGGGAAAAPAIVASSFSDSTDTASYTLTGSSPITLYWVLDASATPPSVAQVKAGQNNAGAAAVASGSQGGLSTGSNDFTADVSGVVSGDYYLYSVASNDGGDSAVDSEGPITISNAILAKWIPSATSAWTDSVGGTQAGIGDQVAVLQDLSGGGNHFVFASGKRPLLQQEGTGEYYLDFTGSQGGSVAINLSAQTALTVCGGYKRDTTSLLAWLEYTANINSNPGGFLLYGEGLAFRGALNNGSSVHHYSVGDAVTTAAVVTWAWDFAGTTIATEHTHVRRNGSDTRASPSAFTNGATTNFANSTLYLGARGTTSLYMDGRFYGVGIYSGTLSGADLSSVETEISANVPGVSL